MKISEFARRHQVSVKLLRHYDEIGLLKPSAVDPDNGYRCYTSSQDRVIQWILVLKQLDFSLHEIKELLSDCVEASTLLTQLALKREKVTAAIGEQMLKRFQIDRLVQLIETEGFYLDKPIDLMALTPDSVHEIKKHMPNTEMFLEMSKALLMEPSNNQEAHYAILRIDIGQFKQVNDRFGYEVGDKVIVAAYQAVSQSLSSFEQPYLIGRAGGDEFTVFVKGTPQFFETVGKAILQTMTTIDFTKLGCDLPIQFYVSGLYAPLVEGHLIRQVIDMTMDTLVKSKTLGIGTLLIEPKMI